MCVCFLERPGGLAVLPTLGWSALVDLRRALGVSAECAAEDGEGRCLKMSSWQGVGWFCAASCLPLPAAVFLMWRLTVKPTRLLRFEKSEKKKKKSAGVELPEAKCDKKRAPDRWKQNFSSATAL